MGEGAGASGEGLGGRCVGVVTYVQMGGEGRSLQARGWRGRRLLWVEGRHETRGYSRVFTVLCGIMRLLGILFHISRSLLTFLFVFTFCLFYELQQGKTYLLCFSIFWVVNKLIN